ncbi:MAG: hypothetical protein IPL61_13155 [Myxococcales bacterium]|nr:hypothetical protein [Myxococcales bacterium]
MKGLSQCNLEVVCLGVPGETNRFAEQVALVLKSELSPDVVAKQNLKAQIDEAIGAVGEEGEWSFDCPRPALALDLRASKPVSNPSTTSRYVFATSLSISWSHTPAISDPLGTSRMAWMASSSSISGSDGRKRYTDRETAAGRARGCVEEVPAACDAHVPEFAPLELAGSEHVRRF